MKRVFLFFITVFLIFAVSADLRIKYYLSEHDFLSEHPIPQSEIANRSYIGALYDAEGRLITKTHYNKDDTIERVERYTYLDTGNTVRQKDVYIGTEKLVQQTIFGSEEKSHAYIKYIYGVDTVKAWEDRFTMTYFRDDGQAYLHEFRDVDGYHYGNVGFTYDSLGYMESQLWIHLPSRRIMRRWDYQFDPLTEVTRIMEYDSNSVLISDMMLSADGSESVLWFTSPSDSAFINYTRIGYTLDSDLEYGHFLLQWVGGNVDPADTHRFDLSAAQITMGDYPEINLQLDSFVVDGAVYRILFNGKSTKGNLATERRIDQVTFDMSAPVLSLAIDPYINKPEFLFQSNESLSVARLIWRPDSADQYRGQTVMVTFSREELELGGQGKIQLIDQQELQDNVIYNVTLIGRDRAGNISQPVLVPGVQYDISPPVLTVTYPEEYSYFNRPGISVSFSEDLSAASIIYQAVGGKVDLQSPHTKSLTALQLFRGENKLEFIDPPKLIDGAKYNLIIFGSDLAGNPSDTTVIRSVQFDVTPPVLTMIYPASEVAIKEPSVSYVTNEALGSAEFRWESSGGTSDTTSPHIVPLVEEELYKGEQIHIQLRNEPTLTDGSIYTITLIGQDLAGNASEFITVKDVLYDAVPPVITALDPLDNAAINYLNLSYSISENLERGTVTWTRTGGMPDRNSPYRINLMDDELSGGQHQGLLLANTMALNDGSIYRVEYNGTDQAGNRADSVIVTNILYDVTSPTITVAHPVANRFLPDLGLTYSLSEDLFEGYVTWNNTGGTIDSLSPHIIELNPGDRKTGEYVSRILMDNLPVQEGARYELTFSGRDRAGNEAEVVTIPGITYDFTPPSVQLIAPADMQAVNHKQISYSLSENFVQAQITWEWVRGKPDPQKSHVQKLQGSELLAGEYLDILLRATPDLVDGAFYSIQIEGQDYAGNEAPPVSVLNVLYDFTAPVIVMNYPAANQFTPKRNLSYSLSEEIYSGTIVWERSGGNPDDNAPHRIELSENERRSGDHNDILLVTDVPIIEGTIYTLTLSGRDRAGNIANEIILPNITYDFTPPQVSLLAPVANLAVNHIRVSYELSENLSNAWITWEWVDGISDVKKIHRQALQEVELAAGDHPDIFLIQPPALVDGGIYTITLEGADFAGNSSNRSEAGQVLYDNTAPVITLSSPQPYKYIASSTISYELSETIESGSITFTRTVGSSDDNSPHEIELTTDQKQAGRHTIFQTGGPELAEGSVYTIQFGGQDRAGNQASAVTIQGVIYDATPPSVTLISPLPESSINQTKLSYSNSELLESGVVTWTRTGGAEDPNSPHKSALVKIELDKGDYVDQLLQNFPALNNGSIYRIEYTGVDPAGNSSETISVSGIRYDVTAPEIIIETPLNDVYTSKTEVSFSISEQLTSGKITWQGQAPDGSTMEIIQELSGQSLIAGDHSSHESGIPELLDGSVYTVTIEGTDLAGNIATPARIVNYHYDITAPVFSDIYPLTGGFVNNDIIGFTTSENLFTGTVEFIATGGIADPVGTHSIDLVMDEMMAGIKIPARLKNQTALQDEAEYTIRIFGKDLAGNESDTLTVTNIVYDISSPEIKILSPASDAFILTTDLEVEISEQMVKAELIWSPESGEKQSQLFKPEDLVEGLHLITGYPVNIQENVYYSVLITGIDQAGNSSESNMVENLTYDGTPPQIMVSYPVANSATNHNRLNYSLSEDLSVGQVIWEGIRGNDPKSPHTRNLTGDELAGGNHENILLSASPDLVNDVVYRLRISGTDLAGNEAAVVMIDSVRFDSSPPVFSLSAPADSSYVNKIFLEYDLSEDLAEGKIIFTEIKGVKDANSPHTINLTSSKLRQGSGGGALPKGLVTLVNGAVYNISFWGRDAAGNETAPTSISDLHYDIQAPVLTLVLPQSKSFITSNVVSYFINEDLLSAAMIFKQVNSKTDDVSTLKIELTANEKVSGDYKEVVLENMLDLVDAATYTILLEGTDKAGNTGRAQPVTEVTYDVSAPVITVFAPVENQEINSNLLALKLSENLKEGSLIVTRIDGVPDPLSPQTVEWQGAELSAGRNDFLRLSGGPKLINGTRYKFEFNGQDFAGNSAETIVVSNVVFDNEPPVVSITAPVDAEQIKTTHISYMLSDKMAWGEIIFTQTGGTVDPNSPHTIKIEESGLTQGLHTDLELPLMKVLADGGRYSISIRGADGAGNLAQMVEVKDVFFDVLPPVITITSPAAGALINTPRFGFITSEEMSIATATFTRTGGADDPNSPHQIDLPKTFLLQGAHPEVQLEQINLIDGSEYSITLVGTDLAGNQAEPLSVKNINFDTNPPVYTVQLPTTESHVRQLVISYQLSETIESGLINITRREGALDQKSPHTVELQGDQLLAGSHDKINISGLTELISGTNYTVEIRGVDLAGNEAEPLFIDNVIVDFEAPEIVLLSPEESVNVNHTRFSIKNSEVLQTLKITWEWMQGEPDPASPHVFELPGSFLEQGTFRDIELPVPPALKSAASYKIVLTGSDLAGNESSAEKTNIYFDNEPPVMTMITPATNNYINGIAVQYELSKPLQDGILIWTATGGEPDPASPHRIQLSEQELTGSFGPALLNNQSGLQDGAIYTLTFQGNDLSGNTANSVLAEGITYDVKVPVFSNLFPTDGSYINSSVVRYSLSEEVATGSITWQWLSGAVDSESSHRIELSGEFLLTGNHEFSVPITPGLTSGTTYQIVFNAIDRAGNSSTDHLLTDITYDINPPELTIVSPLSGEFINHSQVDFRISEPLKEGTLTFIQTGGKPDAQSPRQYTLTGTELTTVTETGNPILNPPVLQDGTIYSINFNGVDLSGNTAEPVTVTDILYDVTPPVIKVTSPTNNQFMSTKNLSYSITEDLSEGTVTWSRSGGADDPQSPYTVQLSEVERKAGDYQQILLTVHPDVIDGTSYIITFEGRDQAGNDAVPVTVTGITYDFTKPEIAFNYPVSGKAVNHKKVSYNQSEELRSAVITWRQVGGESDSQTHEQTLVSTELQMGPKTNVSLINSPNLVDGAIYSLEFSGEDRAGNPASPVLFDSVLYDFTQPEFTISKPLPNKVAIGPAISYSLSENVVSGSVTWVREGGLPDPNSPHTFELSVNEKLAGDFSELILENQPELAVGAIYSLMFQGEDRAGNRNKQATVRRIEMVRRLDGNWYFKGAIMTVAWTFEGDPDSNGNQGSFAQGVQMGTKISNQEFGRFTLDYSQKPWIMEWELESGQKRISLFEFQDNNHLKVVTGTKKPKNWSDGEVMIYEFRP